ncbi:MAG: 30S ribosomal protein S17 [Planctomycetales bacterium]|nr:30S ribosomal protein S17 [Planctomycetales bacterium]
MKRKYRGVVASDKSSKTIRVDVERVFRDRRYGKTLRRTIVCHVHDEQEKASVGDYVEIIESRPLSKLKRWSLVGVVRTVSGAN